MKTIGVCSQHRFCKVKNLDQKIRHLNIIRIDFADGL
eukprot:COSAG02_NODE_7401_length_3034_cov_3.660307_4_plen_37_part_00